MKAFLIISCLFLSTQAWALKFNLNRELGNQKRCTEYLYSNDYVYEIWEGWNFCGWNDVETLRCGVEVMDKGYEDEFLPALNACKRNQRHHSFACAEKLYKGHWTKSFFIAQNMCEWYTPEQIQCAKATVQAHQSPDLVTALLEKCAN